MDSPGIKLSESTRCCLLALRRQSKGLIHDNDFALHFADGADTYSIVSEGIPDQALVSRARVGYGLQNPVAHLLEGWTGGGEVHPVDDIVEQNVLGNSLALEILEYAPADGAID